MKQFRNDHNLMNDFKQEIPMYNVDKKNYDIILKLKLKKCKNNYLDNLNSCYQALIQNKILLKSEKKFLNA